MPDRSKMTWTTDANGGGQTGLYTVNGTEYKAYVRNNGSWALYRSGSHVILAQGKEPGVIGAKTAARKAAEKQPESPTRAESLLGKISESYTIEPLDKTEYTTLCWLADHGYDADILSLTSGEETEDGGYKSDPIPEHVAWQINDVMDENPHAFLSSNGSKSLADKLYKFLDSIV